MIGENKYNLRKRSRSVLLDCECFLPIIRKGEKMNVQLKKGNLDLCVLALLCENDMYGFELVGRISEAIQISEGTIYPLLKRIKDVGYVTTYLKESNEGPPRKYYSITAAGINEKMRLADEWYKFADGVNKIVGGKGEKND